VSVEQPSGLFRAPPARHQMWLVVRHKSENSAVLSRWLPKSIAATKIAELECLCHDDFSSKSGLRHSII